MSYLTPHSLSAAYSAAESSKMAIARDNYVRREIIEQDDDNTYDYMKDDHKPRTEIPGRLDTPLIPYPASINDYLTTRSKESLKDWQSGHRNAIVEIISEFETSCKSYGRIIPNVKTSIDDLKDFYRKRYTARGKSTHTAAYMAAADMAFYDLSLVLDKSAPGSGSFSPEFKPIDLLLIIQRLRGLMMKGKETIATSNFEPSLVRKENGLWLFYCENLSYNYDIILYGEHFLIRHSSVKHAFLGPKSYLDYLYTLSDVENNITIIKSINEYSDFDDLVNLLITSVIEYRPHNELVTFFKNYEALCLYLADVKAGDIANWDPIIDTINNMIVTSNEFCKHKLDLEWALEYINEPPKYYKEDNLFIKLIMFLQKLTPLQLLEASSLHKFVFFAEVDVIKGLKKFVTRTHTPVHVERDNLIELLGMTKREFVMNYYRKHDALPNIEYPEEKATIIANYLKSKDKKSLEEYPLTWWYDLKLGKTLSYLDGGHPVEYAKDKGAIINDIHYGPMDNKRELNQVMMDPDYKVRGFLHKIKESYREPEFIKTKIKSQATHFDFPVRLCEKEKEQKVEARLFGVADAKFKHEMSSYMAKAKEVLSYFDENYMTMSDSRRKEDLHEMAQLLERDDTLAIMIDITGHNQSMQPDNTYELLEFIGNIYGEDGWGKLSYLFNNLEVYHYNHYTNEVHISRGQRGGIEGWMNPVWTLITLQQVKLLRYTTPLSINKIAGYSDDVSFIITSLDHTDKFINSSLKIVSKELGRLGFVVKPQQSAVSKKRVTMLRTHYINGQRADSTLKRLLSLSTANSDKISCEEFEVNAISSSASSAMEGSYHVKTATFLKWYKSCLVSFRMFAMLFEERRVNSMISPLKLPTDIASILYNIDGIDIHKFEGERKTIERTLSIKLERIKDNLSSEHEKLHFVNWVETLKSSSIENIKSISVPDALLYLAGYNSFIPQLWFYVLVMPQSLGGLGVELCINQCMSGHSDNLLRSFYYIHRIINTMFPNSAYFNDCLTNSLKHHALTPIEESNLFNEHREFDEELEEKMSVMDNNDWKTDEVRLLNNKWLLNNKVRSALSHVQSSIFGKMKSILKNKQLLNMMKAYDNKGKLAVGLTSVFRKNYSHRVIQFYYENSYLSMAQYLLKKLETSTSLLNSVKNLDKLKASVSVRARNNALEMLSCNGAKFGRITSDTDVLNYMISRRKTLAPAINFVDIEEPLYDHILERSQIDNSLLTVYPTVPKEYKNGTYGYKLGLHSSETLYKGEISEEDTILKAREEMLVCKLLAVTKWAVLKNNRNYYKGEENLEFDFIIACNWSLSTFIREKYHDLELYVPLNLGGEILHRIPNQKFKSKVATRVMPNTIQGVKVMLNQSMIADRDLEDSNVNFEYIRYRLMLLYAMNYHYDNVLPLVDSYNFNSLANISNVQDFKPLLMSLSGTHSNIIPTVNLSDRINLERISIGSAAYLYSDDLHDAIVARHGNKNINILRKVRERNESIMFDYYSSLSKEMLIVDFGLESLSTWKPLMDKLRKLTTEYDEVTDLELYNIIIKVISRLVHEKVYSSYHNVAKERYSFHIQNLRNSAGELSEEYKSLVAFIKLNKSKVAEDISKNSKSPAITAMARHFSQLSADLFNDLSLGYCLHLRKIAGKLEIDCNATYTSVCETVENSQFNFNLPESIRATIFYIGISRLLEILTKKKEMFLFILRKIDENTEDIDVFEEKINIKYPSIEFNLSDINIPDSALEVVYRGFEINSTVFYDWRLLNKSLFAMKKISELYTNQVAFTSPTGSDSLIAQYGFFKAMIDYDYITEETEIVNLAAGRGDGRIACMMNGLTSKDYSRPSLFSKILLVKGVDDTVDFDLTKFETLPQIDNESHVHIDISHVTGDLSGFEDTICNLVSLGHQVSIRANSLSSLTDNFAKWLKDSPHEITFWHATSRKILPYQTYILICPLKNKTIDEEIHFTENTDYKMMMNLWFTTVDIDNLYAYPVEDIKNSIMAVLPEHLNAEELIKAVKESSDNDKVSNSLKQLIRLGEINDVCIIDNDTVKSLTDQKSCEIIDLKPCGRHEDYNVSSDDEIGNTKRKGFKYWKKSVDGLLRKELVPSQFRISIQSLETIKALSHYYPVAKYRSFFHNLIELSESGLDIREVEYSEYIGILAEHSGNNPGIRNNDNSLIREVLSVCIVAAMKHNYSWGIDILSSTKMSSSREKTLANKKISIYKKMGSLFRRLRTQEAVNENSHIYLNELEKNLRKKGIIKLRKMVEESEYRSGDDNVELLRRMFSSTAEGLLDKINDGTVNLGPSLQISDSLSLESQFGTYNPRPIEGSLGIDGTINASNIVESGVIGGLFGNAFGMGSMEAEIMARIAQAEAEFEGEDMNWDDNIEDYEEY